MGVAWCSTWALLPSGTDGLHRGESWPAAATLLALLLHLDKTGWTWGSLACLAMLGMGTTLVKTTG